MSDGDNCNWPEGYYVTFPQLGRIEFINDSRCRNTVVGEWYEVVSDFDQVLIATQTQTANPGQTIALTVGIEVKCGRKYQVDLLRGEKTRSGPPNPGDEFYSRWGGYYNSEPCERTSVPGDPPVVRKPNQPVPPVIYEPPVELPPPTPCVRINQYHCVPQEDQ